MGLTIAVDVGGTFTDLVVLDRSNSRVSSAKSPTTPTDPSEGIFGAIDRAGIALADVELFIHGTTLGLNALLQRAGATVGLLTTQGFRDVLELRRMDWPMYQLHWAPPRPLVERALRREIPERLRSDGEVITPLSEIAVRREAEVLGDRGVTSIAVCYINAYAHPEHELRTREILEEELPELSVSLSHEVSPEPREYERTATVVADAFIKPLMRSYLDHLDGSLRRAGFSGTLLVTRCDGGAMTVDEAKRLPARTLLSGPASGVLGAANLARSGGVEKLIGMDMGGTSFDASLVFSGEPTLQSKVTLGDLPLLLPVVDIVTIGAGGGSVASVDQGGGLQVGPTSAGADPGPACYGNGGSDPTFTDAALVSGLLNPDNFLGGQVALDVSAAEEAIDERVARPLGIDLRQAAAGIVALAEAKMATALEEITIRSGLDPRDFHLLAFGGGGSLVASGLASRLGGVGVIVPALPGTFSAWGMLNLDIVHDAAAAVLRPLDGVPVAELDASFGELEQQAEERLAAQSVPGDGIHLQRSVDLRYAGQEHVLNIAVRGDASVLEDLARDFSQRHQEAYGYALADGIELTSYRVRAVRQLGRPAPHDIEAGSADAADALVGQRRAIHLESGGEHIWHIYDRDRLRPGNRLVGPALIEERAATTLVSPVQEAVVDRQGTIHISAATAECATGGSS